MNNPRNFKDSLIDPSFRAKRGKDPESSDFNAIISWIPADAGMTSKQLIRDS